MTDKTKARKVIAAFECSGNVWAKFDELPDSNEPGSIAKTWLKPIVALLIFEEIFCGDNLHDIDGFISMGNEWPGNMLASEIAIHCPNLRFRGIVRVGDEVLGKPPTEICPTLGELWEWKPGAASKGAE